MRRLEASRLVLLVIMPVLLGTGCSDPKPPQGFEPDYLELVCGKWSVKSVLRTPDGRFVADVMDQRTYAYDPERQHYHLQGLLTGPDGVPIDYSEDYRRLSKVEAAVHFQDCQGLSRNGALKQTESNRIEEVIYDEAGAVYMQLDATFTTNTITSTVRYHENGVLCIIAEGVAHRVIPATEPTE